MRQITSIIPIAIVFTFAMTAFAPAQTPSTAPSADPDEVAAVRKAADAFLPLLKGDDAAAIKKEFGGSEPGLRVALKFRDALSAAQEAKAALSKKFPNEMPASGVGIDASLLAMIKRMQTQAVTIKDDTANIGNPIGGVTLKKIDGTWKVADLISDPDGKLQMEQILGAIVRVSHEFRGEVDAGKFADLKVATESLAKKMKMATAVFIPKTQSTTKSSN